MTMLPITYGYARVSKADDDSKNLDTQLRLLADHGIRKDLIFTDVSSGRTLRRPGWREPNGASAAQRYPVGGLPGQTSRRPCQIGLSSLASSRFIDTKGPAVGMYSWVPEVSSELSLRFDGYVLW